MTQLYKPKGAYLAKTRRSRREWNKRTIMHWKRRKRGLMNLYYKTGYKNAYKY